MAAVYNLFMFLFHVGHHRFFLVSTVNMTMLPIKKMP